MGQRIEHKKRRRWRIEFTADARDTLNPVIAADVINNLRFSLDHLMCALVPGDSAPSRRRCAGRDRLPVARAIRQRRRGVGALTAQTAQGDSRARSEIALGGKPSADGWMRVRKRVCLARGSVLCGGIVLQAAQEVLHETPFAPAHLSGALGGRVKRSP